MSTLPTVMTAAGLQPIPPAVIRQTLVDGVAATNPGYTANLPGTLIEDIASTDVAAIVQMDQARQDLVNSLTPYGANEFLLLQLGNIYGVTKGIGSNTSVNVVFTGPPGFVIAKGFVVSDGSFQYILSDGGVIGSGGSTTPLFALASTSGTWAVPDGTVNQLITAIPSEVGAVTVTNPLDGVPGGDTQTEADYRAQVLQAGLAVSQGMTTMLRTALQRITGVQARLIGIRQQDAGGWSVIVGGGDPYDVAYAIFTGLFDISSLVGSLTTIRNQTVTINDFPDNYSVVYILPPLQAVQVSLTWNTTALNFISDSAVAQLGSPAIVNYINSIAVGQPINIFVMQSLFTEAISSVIPPEQLDRMVFSVIVDGVAAPPNVGTQIIPGDPESYFFTNASGTQITIIRG